MCIRDSLCVDHGCGAGRCGRGRVDCRAGCLVRRVEQQLVESARGSAPPLGLVAGTDRRGAILGHDGWIGHRGLLPPVAIRRRGAILGAGAVVAASACSPVDWLFARAFLFPAAKGDEAEFSA